MKKADNGELTWRTRMEASFSSKGRDGLRYFDGSTVKAVFHSLIL